jgi:hypothetical protein
MSVPRVTILTCLALAGCASQRTELPELQHIAAAEATTPLDASPEALKTLLFDTSRDFAEFFMGDLLTTNFDLTLLSGGGYALKRRGCEGTYGVSVGSWRLLRRSASSTSRASGM